MLADRSAISIANSETGQAAAAQNVQLAASGVAEVGFTNGIEDAAGGCDM